MTTAARTTSSAPRRAPGVSRWRQAPRLLAQQNDLALVALLIAIVAALVLPLPTMLFDFMVASNLAISLALLFVAIYVPSSLSLSTFPSLLLFTTLFRLGLNIASIKLILMHAHAGQIIDTFGRLIVGNNVVIGGVVFLTIAIVQFIVVAKGSERVAEVAARFALDALPGKQMSIDAEVRSGMLSSAQAQRRRRALEQESQLSGAMDGAMKYVKGDAIAGIVIALFNILAGVAIGTLMHDMGIGQALQRYAVLTVGDGMVSQIPSMLVAIAAGIVITRVGAADDKHPQHLAGQILSQVSAHPRALFVAAVALSAFLLVPGFPRWIFGFWVLVMIAVGAATLRTRRRGQTPGWISHHEPQSVVDESSDDAVTSPVALRLSSALRGRIELRRFDLGMIAARQRTEVELGPVFPRLQLAFSDALADGRYQVLVQDVVASEGELRPGRLMVDAEDASTVPPGGEVAEPFGPFARVVWVAPGRSTGGALSVEEVLVAHVEQVARRHAPQLIGLQEVQRLLQWTSQQMPDLAAEVTRNVPAQRIAETLRRLLQEGVPVRNLRSIFESLVRWAPKQEDGIALAELVRVDLGHFITSLHVGADRRLDAVLFDTALLDRVEAAIDRSPRGNLLLLDPAIKQAVLEQVRAALDQAGGDVAIVVSTDVRRYVRMLIEPVAPRVPVLSYQEIDEDVVLQPVAWITLPPSLAADPELAAA